MPRTRMHSSRLNASTVRLLSWMGAAVLIMLVVAPARAQDYTGQIVRGRVVDADARFALPGANVVVVDSAPLIGSSTDLDGRFALEKVPLGRHDFRVSFVGYRTVILPEVLVSSGKEVVLEIEMKQEVLLGEEVVVRPDVRKDRALNDLAFVSARSFSVEETRRYAGGFDDPARMASAFAGITTGGSIQENAMIIRGNAPKGVLWRLEGVEIPNPSHFAGLTVAGGGGLTLFSSQLLADSDFFTGAFPAEYGNALAGVFDMNFRTGNASRREHALQAGVLGLEAASEGPFFRGSASTYLFNYRYSTLGLLISILPTEDVATYQDLSFKLSFPTPRAGRFELWGLGGLDRQSGSATADSTEWEYEYWDRIDSELRLGIGAAGLSHDLILGRSGYLHSTLAATVNRTDLEQLRLGDDLELHDDLSLKSTNARFVFGSYANIRMGSRLTSRTGFELQRLYYDLNVAAPPERGLARAAVAREEGSSTLARLYTQSNYALSSTLFVDAGLHVQHFALTRDIAIEPRAGLRWEAGMGHLLSAGYGLHSRIEDLRIYFARPPANTGLPNRRLDFTRAHHFVLGYDRTLGESNRLKTEIYYQSLFDVPVIPDSSYSLLNFEQDFEFREALVSDGAGENYGVEMTLERFLRDGFYYLVTGSVFRSRYRGGDGIWRETRFDRGYAFNGLFGKEITVGGDDLVGINGRLILMGGRRRSPVDGAASLAREEVVYDASRAFEEREPAIFIMDLTLTWRRNHASYAEVWALQVKNALAAKDVSRDYNYATRRVEEVKEGFPLPVLSYKIEF